MGLDEVRAADTKAWLVKARLDIRGAQVDLAAVPPLVADALFHAQQACEKSMKAFLTWHDIPFRKTHDLGAAGEQCCVVDPTLEPLFREAAHLTQYAWRFRYPGENTEPAATEGDHALALAERVVAEVADRLGPAFRA